MTLEEMREHKRRLGYSNETLAKLSGVPLATVQKVMSGVTKNPRQRTLEALARVLDPAPTVYPRINPERPWGMVSDSAPAYKIEPREYTIEDIYALPDGIRAELVDGKIYFMACPSRTHQDLVGEMYLEVANFIRSNDGSCKVYIPPFAVYVFGDESCYFEPDLTVICDENKLDDKGCWGAPDWIVEVLSPSSKKMDNVTKFNKYRQAGVREYWIIYPYKRLVMVHIFQEGAEDTTLYSFEDQIPSFVFHELKIRLADHI